MIKEEHEKIHQEVVADLKSARGRVSYTSDMWSDQNLTSYMAITAHYADYDKNGKLCISSRLFAFRAVAGMHSGENLANIFFGMLRDAGLLHKVTIIWYPPTVLMLTLSHRSVKLRWTMLLTMILSCKRFRGCSKAPGFASTLMVIASGALASYFVKRLTLAYYCLQMLPACRQCGMPDGA